MNRIYSFISLSLIFAEIILILLSWILSTIMTEGVRSLLSAEGIRWFVGHFSDMLLNQCLVWLILIAIGWGCLKNSRLLSFNPSDYRQKMALKWSVITLLIYSLAICYLIFTPHAILISATGELWPSPFSHALIPVLSFGLLLVSVNYGLISHSFKSITTVFNAMVNGICEASSLIIVYVFAVQLYYSCCYVFL